MISRRHGAVPGGSAHRRPGGHGNAGGAAARQACGSGRGGWHRGEGAGGGTHHDGRSGRPELEGPTPERVATAVGSLSDHEVDSLLKACPKNRPWPLRKRKRSNAETDKLSSQEKRSLLAKLLQKRLAKYAP